METFIGLNATLFISHKETDEKTYANIETVLPRKKNNKVVFFEQKPSGQYTRVVQREGYKQPAKYAEMMNAE